jgi:DNA repair photolyase
VSRRIEPRTGTTEERIEAARKLQEAGYTVRYKCKPIIPVRGWQEEAADMIEGLFAATSPDVISLFCFAWSTVDDMKACLDVGLLDPRFVRAAEESVEEVRDTMCKPFPEWARAEIYEHYLGEIRKRSADVPVSLSTETWAMWKRFEGALGATARNYVCGCGPQSVPGRRLLDVDPFSVAVRCPVNVGDDGKGWYGEQRAAD